MDHWNVLEYFTFASEREIFSATNGLLWKQEKKNRFATVEECLFNQNTIILRGWLVYNINSKALDYLPGRVFRHRLMRQMEYSNISEYFASSQLLWKQGWHTRNFHQEELLAFYSTTKIPFRTMKPGRKNRNRLFLGTSKIEVVKILRH